MLFGSLRVEFTKFAHFLQIHAGEICWRFTFRRWLPIDLKDHMRGLHRIICTITLSSQPDIPVWKWSKSGIFTIKLVYTQLCKNGIDRSFKYLWKAKILLKIKVWLWLI
jgi:hypothetical protein